MDTITAAALAAHPHWGEGPPAFAPLGALMFCLLIALLIAGLIFAFTRHRGAPPWAGHRPHPEEEARHTLADRFARGDLTVEEFMERASALNWTPGKNEGPGKKK